MLIRMKVVIQNRATGWYLKVLGAWTTNPKLALGFPNLPAAARFCAHYQLANVTLACFESGRLKARYPADCLQPAIEPRAAGQRSRAEAAVV